MKRIEAIIRPFKLQDVIEALSGEHSIGVPGMTTVEVQGYGRQKGHTDVYRGTEYAVDLVPKVMLILYVNDASVDAIVNTIIQKAYTGLIGDGKIAVSELIAFQRIRTGESGDEAL